MPKATRGFQSGIVLKERRGRIAATFAGVTGPME
jgi:hypothetical protein